MVDSSPITDYPRVAIIILNWNGWEDTLECLESLYQITYPTSEAVSVNALRVSGKGCYEVIVVDNGSEDDSIEKIKEYCEGKIKVESKFFEYSRKNKPIKIIEYTREEAEAGGGRENEIAELLPNRKLILIRNERNYGFAEGNNIGMRYALKALNPDYVLLLNNDTVVDRAFLGELVKVAESDPYIGFAGPKIYYYDFNGRKDTINFAGGNFSMWKAKPYHIGANEIDKGQYDRIREVDYVEGSCLLVRKRLIKNVGLLNSRYFAYWEDNDWCLRGYESGYKSVYVSKAKIWHKISGSSSSQSYVYYMIRNKILFMRQHATLPQYFLFVCYFFLFQFWFTSGIFVIYHRNFGNFISFFNGVVDGFRVAFDKE